MFLGPHVNGSVGDAQLIINSTAISVKHISGTTRQWFSWGVQLIINSTAISVKHVSGTTRQWFSWGCTTNN